jgi:CRISPR-associated protein Csd1
MTILQALDRYYDRMAERGEAVPPGYSIEPIGFVLVLVPDGSLVDIQMNLDASGRRGKQQKVPKWFGRQGIGSTPFFLWDNTAYALGVSDKDPAKTARDHAAFKKLHEQVLAAEQDTGLKALRLFLERWTPDQFVAPKFDPKLFKFNLAFRLDGELQFIHERPAATRHIDLLRTSVEHRSSGFCLITGQRGPLVDLHPKIKGIEGTAAAEVPLVSFNAAAFESYEQKQGNNAPTSETAAFRYGAALNRMLDRGSRNRIQRTVGDTTVACWADASGVGEAAADAAEDLFGTIFDPPAVTSGADNDAQETAKLRDRLEDFAKGRPLKEIDLRLEDGTRFYVLGLAPNAARLSVRFWLEDDFEHIARRLGRHARDLAMEPKPRGWTRPPSIQRLLVKTTALQEKFDNIPPQLAGEVARAVLTGLPYPRTLLSATITRLRAGDDPGSGWHAAVIKACINRSLCFRFPRGSGAESDAAIYDRQKKGELSVARDPNYPSTAYHLGRLFYLLEAAQREALGRRINAPIGDRYYAGASATPARVFGPLLRGLKHHVSDAKKQNRGHWIEAKVGEIMLMLPPDLPKTLRLEDQGRFAVGYYHERATRPKDDEPETEGEDNDE